MSQPLQEGKVPASGTAWHRASHTRVHESIPVVEQGLHNDGVVPLWFMCSL